MQYLNVAARNVKVGDEVYNPAAIKGRLAPAFRWCRVTKVDVNEDCRRVVVCTAAFDSWYHPQEAVAIRRAEPCGT